MRKFKTCPRCGSKKLTTMWSIGDMKNMLTGEVTYRSKGREVHCFDCKHVLVNEMFGMDMDKRPHRWRRIKK